MLCDGEFAQLRHKKPEHRRCQRDRQEDIDHNRAKESALVHLGKGEAVDKKRR
jgi:hypothetical protein